jgi:hypothetical protein
MPKLVDCVIEEIVNFIKENRIKFIKIKNAINRKGKPKSQYKCEDWMTRELYFRFRDIFHTVEPEPILPSRKSFDLFIKNDEESLWIEAKERFNGGRNKDYLKKDDLIKAIYEFIKCKECKELLFFSTYDKPIDEIIKNENDLAEKLRKEIEDLKEKGKLPEGKEIKVEPTEENKNKVIIKITKEGKEENKIEICLKGKKIKLCHTYYTLYLHFYIIKKL